VIGHGAKAARDQTKANKLDPLAPDRPKAIRQKADFEAPSSLSLDKDQRPVLPPQSGELAKRHMLGLSRVPWIPLSGSRKNRIGFAHALD
jgi:hypothetical protein